MGTQLTLLQSTVNILLYYLMKFQSTILCLLTSSKSTKNNIFVDNYFLKKCHFLEQCTLIIAALLSLNKLSSGKIIFFSQRCRGIYQLFNFNLYWFLIPLLFNCLLTTSAGMGDHIKFKERCIINSSEEKIEQGNY